MGFLLPDSDAMISQHLGGSFDQQVQSLKNQILEFHACKSKSRKVNYVERQAKPNIKVLANTSIR